MKIENIDLLRSASIDQVTEMTRPHREASRYLDFLVYTFLRNTSLIYHDSGLFWERADKDCYLVGRGSKISKSDRARFDNFYSPKILVVGETPPEVAKVVFQLILERTPRDGTLIILPHTSVADLKEGKEVGFRFDQEMTLEVRAGRNSEYMESSFPEHNFDYETAMFDLLQFDDQDKANELMGDIIPTQVWTWRLMERLLKGAHRLESQQYITENQEALSSSDSQRDLTNR